MKHNNGNMLSHALPDEYSQRVYDTESIIEMLIELSEDGYCGLGLGLLVDLVVERLMPATDNKPITDTDLALAELDEAIQSLKRADAEIRRALQ